MFKGSEKEASASNEISLPGATDIAAYHYHPSVVVSHKVPEYFRREFEGRLLKTCWLLETNKVASSVGTDPFRVSFCHCIIGSETSITRQGSIKCDKRHTVLIDISSLETSILNPVVIRIRFR